MYKKIICLLFSLCMLASCSSDAESDLLSDTLQSTSTIDNSQPAEDFSSQSKEVDPESAAGIIKRTNENILENNNVKITSKYDLKFTVSEKSNSQAVTAGKTVIDTITEQTETVQHSKQTTVTTTDEGDTTNVQESYVVIDKEKQTQTVYLGVDQSWATYEMPSGTSKKQSSVDVEIFKNGVVSKDEKNNYVITTPLKDMPASSESNLDKIYNNPDIDGNAVITISADLYPISIEIKDLSGDGLKDILGMTNTGDNYNYDVDFKLSVSFSDWNKMDPEAIKPSETIIKKAQALS